MCGIFCAASGVNVKKRIAEGLHFLEYRGYDSAGMAIIDMNGKLECIKALGEVSNLVKEVNGTSIDGKIGIGHTRWATHGKVTIENTHPISNENIAVIHNGIVENYKEIKSKLIGQGYKFKGDTDTEVILNLLQFYVDNHCKIFDALKQTIKEIKGNYAIAVLFAEDSETIYCVKNGSPLSLGFGDGEIYVSSDVNALALFVDKVITLEDGDIAVVSKDSHKLLDINDKEIIRSTKEIEKNISTNDLVGFASYMLKEISEQPKIIKDIFKNILLSKKNADLGNIDWSNVSKVSIVACGSSYNAGMVAKYWFESYAKISVDLDFASEFRARDIVYDSNALYLFISQSGETLDTLAALKEAKKNGVKTISLVNTLQSSIAYLADYVVPIQAGAEIAVASTKSFSAQLMQLANIVFLAAVDKKLYSHDEYTSMFQALEVELSGLANMTAINSSIRQISAAILEAKTIIFLGRHCMHPIALEGALKLKELSYLPIFASAAGELKHGPIALIDDNSLVIALAPQNNTYHKMMSNIEEVRARGAKVALFTHATANDANAFNADYVYQIPQVSELLEPLFYTIPLQLISHEVALSLGKNVDRPRNLAKSVTVE
jgi:glucosamine--fructose-6-phosphate aminotransferase (isomerizing)